MEKWKGKIAVVTGASSGIGAVIAEELVKLGLLVVGIARRKELIEDLAAKLKDQPGKLYPIKTDITIESEILQTFSWIKTNLGPVSILINNAGVVKGNMLINGDTQEWRQFLNTGVLGLCIATREAVKDMRDNGIDGHIIHINGISGHFIPKFNELGITGAVKSAITALTETLRQELNSVKSKIKITSISPGVVETESLKELKRAEPKYSALPALDPKDIADAIVYVLSTPPHVQVHELMIRPVGETL